MATILYGILVVGGVCLVAVGGLEVVQRLVPAASRQQHNEVAGFIYAVVGVIYAVLLALVVIAVWEDFGSARETVEGEANATAEIFWLAHRLPEPERHRVQELARSYARVVVEREWLLMREGQTPLMEQGEATPTGWVLIDDIRATLQEVEPKTTAEEALYAEGLDQIEELADARRMRLVAAHEGIPAVLWGVDLRGDGGSGLHVPVRAGEHVGAQADGGGLGGGNRAGAVHHRGHGAPLLGRGAHRHGGLRSDTGEVRDEQAQRPPIEAASVFYSPKCVEYEFSEVCDTKDR